MLRTASWIWTGLILAGLLIAAPPVSAQGKKDPPRTVQDGAGLFSKEAIRAANEEIAVIKNQYHKDVMVETVDSVKGVTGDDAWKKWALDRVTNYRVEGVYMAIVKEQKHVQVEIGEQSLKKGDFRVADRKELVKILKENMKEGHPDDALRKAVSYAHDALRENTRGKVEAAPPAPAVAQQNAPVQQEHHGGQAAAGILGGIGGIICLVIVGLLVVWLIFGLIRTFTGGGYYGGGYGPGYGYGGGGGFFPSLLGGMFGAAAGMWMYNHWFGGPGYYGGGYGGGYGSGGAGVAGGGADYGATKEPTDVESGYSGEGADYGDGGAGGGDAGGGGSGGDWGGGDAGGGGGGDWGGGGGDAGGGGDWGGGGGGGGDWGSSGGDWGGGGGGGDFGGGGGDFGGGGGGGDW